MSKIHRLEASRVTRSIVCAGRRRHALAEFGSREEGKSRWWACMLAWLAGVMRGKDGDPAELLPVSICAIPSSYRPDIHSRAHQILTSTHLEYT
ncbi:uncharacterized protein K452DRAFT_107451 [Aplosporella prunicola CBS 121167]|uniref:Uncharacterized protein n=1 Tax=Aplosporella prunicola CBS 121167 TaxID=1176127 RepID=A0A6A6BR19_9PEZI|nr:uncharacterized protein K452DRAFT_107451 [Aplosporella prunicola CBS 121167]KAF2146208.1 hypothetical protein K452DRAFT_107451 [Aplosporella prunicola CBS 121167]